MCGINFMVALVGAMFHNPTLLILGVIFTIWNWFVAEYNKEIEDESIRKSATETKE
jgi:hypothetical protein